MILILFGCLLHLANLILKYMSNKLLTFIPNKNIITSKYGNLDILYEIVLYFMIIARTLIIIYFKHNYGLYQTYYYGVLCLFLILFWINISLPNFYNNYNNFLRNVQLIAGILATASNILARESSIILFKEEWTTMLLLLVFLPIILKVLYNISMEKDPMILHPLKDKHISEKSLLKIYYYVIEYTHRKLET